ncbi:cilia- and flagella-associated protein 77 [Chanos chanos]|uniref:Cilia- and flagella-associated protein 77 n=1 Tax=Chanos chanos TaxID=29144 RepID=A0A6J2WTP6_CHACN|nr:cilia- and flagella-associated protein 77 [Chanos chanos]
MATRLSALTHTRNERRYTLPLVLSIKHDPEDINQRSREPRYADQMRLYRSHPVDIIEPALGKTRSRGLSCPGPEFVYGAVTAVRDGGVSEAISSWHTQSLPASRHGAQRRELERDFVALNRESMKSGLVTAKELRQYRATHDVRRRANATRRPTPARIPPDATFGVSTRPSTPISELIEHKYAQRWLEEQQAKDRVLIAHQKKARLGRVQDTRTTLLRKTQPLPEAPSLWKLPRFQQVGPALDTFRNPEARKKAMNARYSDSVARQDVSSPGVRNAD